MAAVVVGLFVVLFVGTVVGPFSGQTFDEPYDKMVDPLPRATGALAVVTNILTFGVFLIGLMGLLIACLVSMIIRYRRSTGVERAQLKWFAFGASALPGCLLMCWLALLVFHDDDILAVALLVLLVSIPTATTIGLLRHQLYDVDRAVATTVSYGVVTVVLIGLYGAASFLGGAGAGPFLRRGVGRRDGDLRAGAVAAAPAAAPARRPPAVPDPAPDPRRVGGAPHRHPPRRRGSRAIVHSPAAGARRSGTAGGLPAPRIVRGRRPRRARWCPGRGHR